MESMRRVSVLSSNRHKIDELRLVAEEYGIGLDWVKSSKLEIQADDPSEIARIGGVDAYSHLRVPLIVEDTGLFIKGLNGFPGSYAAHVFKFIGRKGILSLLNGKRDRRAYFKSSICYADSRGTKVFEGVLHGRIAEKERGSGGFGFDPIFMPAGSSKTLAQLDTKEKNMVSHRARAFRKFAEYFNPRGKRNAVKR